ncbi:hypothetical protein RRG08_060636, partial [Elysia crispata]
ARVSPQYPPIYYQSSSFSSIPTYLSTELEPLHKSNLSSQQKVSTIRPAAQKGSAVENEHRSAQADGLSFSVWLDTQGSLHPVQPFTTQLKVAEE